MKVGVVSDTHNNLKNIEQIISLFNKEDISFVIHTGDITNKKSLEKFSELKADLVGVYGNNDRKEIGLKEAAKKHKFFFQEPPNLLTLNNRKIAIFHEPELIDSFLKNNKNIDIVVHGHTHRYRNELKEGILYFNPGESAGWQRGKNSIGILNLNQLKAKRIFF